MSEQALRKCIEAVENYLNSGEYSPASLRYELNVFLDEVVAEEKGLTDGERQVLTRARVLEGRDSLDCAYPDREGSV